MTDEDEDRTFDESPPSTERFYVGTIRKLFFGSQSGIVRSESGREIAFVWLHVEKLGRVRHFDDLREGMSVGFDVGWTSKGLRVTTIRAR
jgi:hypothetical protein